MEGGTEKGRKNKWRKDQGTKKKVMKEPIRVKEEGDQGKEGGDEAEDGEHPEPDHRKVLVLLREENLLSAPEQLRISK